MAPTERCWNEQMIRSGAKVTVLIAVDLSQSDIRKLETCTEMGKVMLQVPMGIKTKVAALPRAWKIVQNSHKILAPFNFYGASTVTKI